MSPYTEEADKDGKGGRGGVKLASTCTCLGGSVEKEEAVAQRDASPLSKMMITILMIYRS